MDASSSEEAADQEDDKDDELEVNTIRAHVPMLSEVSVASRLEEAFLATTILFEPLQHTEIRVPLMSHAVNSLRR